MRFQPTPNRQHSVKPVMIITGMLLIVLAFAICISITASGNRQRQKNYLESALRRDITYCYATTGAYPDNLDTIETKYGLVYDKSRFYIDYKIMGKNIYPKVTILELQ